VSFDGDSDYLQVAESSDFDFGTGDFTVEFFFFARDSGSYEYLVTFGNTSGATSSFGLYIQAKSVFGLWSNSGGVITSSTAYNLNQWYHVAIVRASSTFKLYLDGTEIGSASNSSDISSPGGMNVGRWGLASDNQYFNGVISNLRVVKGTAVYTGNFTAPTSKLTAITNTKLLTCQSNRFLDNSATGHTVTPYATSAITAFGAILTSSVYDAAINGASSQLGATNYVHIADGAWKTLGTGDFTWEYWIYPIGENAYHVGDATAGTNISSTFTLGVSSKRAILYYSIQGGEAYSLLSPDSAPYYNNNEWHHFAYVRSGNDHKLYVNGILRNSATRSGTMVDSTGQFNIGNFGEGYAIGAPDGIYCDVRLVKGTAVYSGSTYTVPTAPLTAISNTELLVNFKDGQAIDSAAQNNLTLDDHTNTSTATSKFGTASLFFDGINDYAKTIFKTSFGAGNFTIEYFFRVDNAANNQNLFQFGGSFLPDDDGGPGLGLRTGRWRLYTGANTATHHGSAGPGNDQWYHIAIVRDGTTTKLYVDGTETLSVSDSYDYSSRRYLLLGGGFDGSYDMYGYMDEFRVSYMARYTSDFTAPTEPFPDKGQ
jgi:hypothetical protein